MNALRIAYAKKTKFVIHVNMDLLRLIIIVSRHALIIVTNVLNPFLAKCVKMGISKRVMIFVFNVDRIAEYVIIHINVQYVLKDLKYKMVLAIHPVLLIV